VIVTRFEATDALKLAAIRVEELTDSGVDTDVTVPIWLPKEK
jgi:hypothetical protein